MMLALLMLIPLTMAGASSGRLLEIEVLGDDAVRVVVADAACLDVRCDVVVSGVQERVFRAAARKNEPSSPPPHLGVAWDRLLNRGDDTISLMKALGGPDVTGVDKASWDQDPANLLAYRSGAILLKEGTEYQDAARFLVTLLKQIDAEPDKARRFFKEGALLPKQEPPGVEVAPRLEALDAQLEATQTALRALQEADERSFLKFAVLSLGALFGLAVMLAFAQRRALLEADQRLAEALEELLVDVQSKTRQLADTQAQGMQRVEALTASGLEQARITVRELNALLPPTAEGGGLASRLDALREGLEQLRLSAQGVDPSALEHLNRNLGRAAPQLSELVQHLQALERDLSKIDPGSWIRLAERAQGIRVSTNPALHELFQQLNQLNQLQELTQSVMEQDPEAKLSLAVSVAARSVTLGQSEVQQLRDATRRFTASINAAVEAELKDANLGESVERVARQSIGLLPLAPQDDDRAPPPLAAELERRFRTIQRSLAVLVQQRSEALREEVVRVVQDESPKVDDLRSLVGRALAPHEAQLKGLMDEPARLSTKLDELGVALPEALKTLGDKIDSLQPMLDEAADQARRHREVLQSAPVKQQLDDLKANILDLAESLPRKLTQAGEAAERTEKNLRADLPLPWAEVEERLRELERCIEEQAEAPLRAMVTQPGALLERVEVQVQALEAALGELPTGLAEHLQAAAGGFTRLEAEETPRIEERLAGLQGSFAAWTQKVEALFKAQEFDAKGAIDNLCADIEAQHEQLLTDAKQMLEDTTMGRAQVLEELEPELQRLATHLEGLLTQVTIRFADLGRDHKDRIRAADTTLSAAASELNSMQVEVFESLQRQQQEVVDGMNARLTTSVTEHEEKIGKWEAAFSESMHSLTKTVEDRVRSYHDLVEGLRRQVDAQVDRLDLLDCRIQESIDAYRAALELQRDAQQEELERAQRQGDQATLQRHQEAKVKVDTLSYEARLVRYDAGLLRDVQRAMKGLGLEQDIRLRTLIGPSADGAMEIPEPAQENAFHQKLARRWIRVVNDVMADSARRILEGDPKSTGLYDLQKDLAYAADQVLEVLTSKRMQVVSTVPSRLDMSQPSTHYEWDEALYRRFPNRAQRGTLMTVRARTALALNILSPEGNLSIVKGRVV